MSCLPLFAYTEKRVLPRSGPFSQVLSHIVLKLGFTFAAILCIAHISQFGNTFGDGGVLVWESLSSQMTIFMVARYEVAYSNYVGGGRGTSYAR